MANVVKHATTHRAKGLGGTDPLPLDMPSIIAHLSTQSVTANAEAEWLTPTTTDPDTFLWDPSDPAGLLVKRGGMYEFRTTIQTTAANPARAISIQSGVQSGGPFGGSAIVDANNRFWAGFTFVSAGTHAVLPTFNLWEHVVRAYATSGSDPLRFAVLLDHQGTNFTLTSSTFIITKLNRNIDVEPPEPPA